LDFEYDAQGRRIRKRVWNNTGGTGSPTLERRYVYDGWNVLVELDGTNGVVQSYVWGLDLSGSLQGAGGVGGLVAVRSTGSPARFAVFDGNGNVMALVNGATGQIDAQYEYGPFGEVLRASGPVAKANPFRFSTKYQDDETEFLYYGYRYYDARNGRWVNRDPLGETGGANLYGFVGNSPLSTIDPLGTDYSWPVVPPPGYPSIFQPTSRPAINCSGYGPLYPSTCTDCGKSRIDWYPGKARAVCEGFANQYTGTVLQAEAACVAGCLIAAEAACQAASTKCDDRNCCRLAAHVKCYASCGFLPYKGLPPGAAAVGWNDLLPSVGKTCGRRWFDAAQGGYPIVGP